ncbi:MAG: hypothetical protein ABI744_06475 [Chloroflexota bacterium]
MVDLTSRYSQTAAINVYRQLKACLLVALVALSTVACVVIAPTSSQAPEPTPARTKKPHPSVAATATSVPTQTITTTPTETSSAAPTASASPAPTSDGTVHLFSFPIGQLPSFIILDPASGRLDYTASPNYGEANLSAGFSPDPYSVGMTTGGSIDVSYLGSSCSGFATSAPDLRVNFGGGGSPLLRLYFVGSNGDATIVVNDPYGNFYCVDDSFGTVNPTIDFNNPAGGSYDIWVGSYAASTLVSGTLYLTENSGNHP